MKDTVRGHANDTSDGFPEPSSSRLLSTDSEASSEASPIMIDHRTMHTFAKHSDLTSYVLPDAKIRGTSKRITDFLTGTAMAEIHDPELFHDLPVLFPPPQPIATSADAEPRPFWGLATDDRSFFTNDDSVTSIPVNARIQANLQRYHELKHQGVHFNQTLMENRSFNNPHVLKQLVDFLNIDETRSNLPQVDTGRVDGNWRMKFPLEEQELVEGDPIAIEKVQKEKADAERRSRQTHADPHRKIDFDRGRHDDEPHRPRKRRSSGGTSKSRLA